MRFRHYLYIATLTMLAACSSEEKTTADNNNTTPTEPAEKVPIELYAGIAEGASQVVTRAGTEKEEDDGYTHLALTEGTKVALRVSGVWTGKGSNKGDASGENVVVNALTADVPAGDDFHKTLGSFSKAIHWDDYGTADASNTAGRAAGLTIYGAAVNGLETFPATVLTEQSSAATLSSWTALSWTLAADQTTSNFIANKDLLISNNVSTNTEENYNTYPLDCGNYRFADRETGKLLEFHHAMSKITVNLKAGAGFKDNVFVETPTVTLTSNLANQTSATEWAYTTGTVNVTDGTVLNKNNNVAITMAAGTTTTEMTTAGYKVTKEALVMPGSFFKKDATIMRINADGNIYYVNANKIRAAINSTAHDETDDLTLAGKNYIFNVIVNKTDIVVTATVADWTTVTAATEEPVINVSGNYGTAGDADRTNTFSFYRSTALNNGYSSTDATYYPADATMTYESPAWTMTPQLYWPNHNTHYQFRGVWPQTVITNVTTSPRVETSGEYQVIKVWNVAYDDETFPSDLMIARPEIENPSTTYCTNTETGHTKTLLYDGGICATEGTITLNFRYMMSQVEVNLSTTDGTLHDDVNLSGAVVEIVNVYNTGEARLGSREVVTTEEKSSYTLNTVAGEGNANKRLSAIVPQELTYTDKLASGNVMFKITITNTNGTEATTDDTTDVYYADVNPILESGKSTKVAPNGKWESGYHYVYNLKLSKTEVKVTATLANWTTVNADQDVWF